MTADLTTEAGITVVVGIIIQAVKGLLPLAWNKALPLISVILGIVIGAGYAALTGGNALNGGIAGLFGGATASGIYNVAKGTGVVPDQARMRTLLGRD